MVLYRLKYATLVGNCGRFAEAERRILDAVADSKAYGSYSPWVEYGECERLAFLYTLWGQTERCRADETAPRNWSRQLSITPYVRPPVHLATQPSPTIAPAANRAPTAAPDGAIRRLARPPLSPNLAGRDPPE